ncbi:MAG: hypothetical protein LBC99_06630 [Spirochaetota bacterium]|jgi:hypothetical protein|nr:hypothetical protein [Spirochaetota bacterium]
MGMNSVVGHNISAKTGIKEGEAERLTFEVDKGDSREANLYGVVGDDSVPLDNDRLILVKVNDLGRYAAVAVLTTSQGAQPGEKILYSRKPDGEIAAKISMLNDRQIVLSGDVVTADGSFTCAGKVTPDGTGALCGLPNCLFTSAPQTGSNAVGTPPSAEGKK